MINNIEEVTNSVDRDVSVGVSHLVDDPSAFHRIELGSTHSLKVICQNIRSVNKNLDEFGVFLTRTNVDFDLIVLTESWLQGCGSTPSLNQYTTYNTCNHINQNSGVIVYVRNSINNITVYEPNFSDADCLVVKIGQNYAFICSYRSPSFDSINNFQRSLDHLLSTLKSIPNIYLLGDFNIDICETTTDKRADDYLDLLASHGLLTSHQFPTRGQKFYDHSIVKSKTQVSTMICNPSITDHSCLYLAISMSQPLDQVNKLVNKINYNKALNLLAQVDWSSFYALKDPDYLTEKFISTVSDIIVQCTTTNVVPNRKQILQPWVTPGLLRCMRFRDTLHRRHKKNA